MIDAIPFLACILLTILCFIVYAATYRSLSTRVRSHQPISKNTRLLGCWRGISAVAILWMSVGLFAVLVETNLYKTVVPSGMVILTPLVLGVLLDIGAWNWFLIRSIDDHGSPEGRDRIRRQMHLLAVPFAIGYSTLYLAAVVATFVALTQVGGFFSRF